MKFYCDNCQTKYSIADEKVQGKVLKVRCKSCSHIITVREPRAPVAGNSVAPATSKSVSPPAPPSRPRSVEWHYSINGESFGPFTDAALVSKFETGELGDAVYVWNETFTAWKPVGEVSAFQSALRRGKGKRSDKSTLALSSALEALDREKVEQEERKLELLAQTRASKERAPEKGTREENPRDRQQNRLEALRSRLKLDEPIPGALGAEPSAPSLEAVTSDVVDEEPVEEPKRESSKPGFDPNAESVKRFELDLGALDEEEEDQHFAFSDTIPPGREESSPEASSHDGLFAGMEESVEPAQLAQEQKEDKIPFFGSAPRLGKEKETSKSRMEEVTGSLLIQLNAIKSDGRRRAVFTVLASILALVTVGAVGYYGFTMRGDEIEEDHRPRVRADHVGQAPEFRSLSQEDRARASLILGEELVVSREVGRAAYAEEQGGAAPRQGPATSGRQAPSTERVTAPRINPDSFRIAGDDGATRAIDDGSGAAGSRFQRTGLAGIGSDEGTMAGGSRPTGLAGAQDEQFEDERLQAMARLQTDTQRGIYNPREEFQELVGTRERLSSGDIAQGMQNVMASVGSCRERHILRGGTIDHDRVEVTLNIEPSGRVGAFSLSPAAIRETDFGRCMNSHTGRWRFPPFQSEAIEIRTPFLLQD